MTRLRRFKWLFILVAVIACGQFTGIETAFCCDSADNAGCHDCVTCAHQAFTELTITKSSPEDIGHRFFLKNAFQYSQHVPIQILRPPIHF